MESLPSFSPSKFGFVRAAVSRRELAWPTSPSTRRRSSPRCGEAAGAGPPPGRLPSCASPATRAPICSHQRTLLEAAHVALDEIAARGARWSSRVVVGLPLAVDGRLFNCARRLSWTGGCSASCPRPTCPPPTSSTRSAGLRRQPGVAATVDGRGGRSPSARDLLFPARQLRRLVIGIEICEDLWAVNPPSGDTGGGRRDGAAQPLGQQRAVGQSGTTAATWCASSRRAAWPPISTRGRGGRINHRHGLGRAHA